MSKQTKHAQAWIWGRMARANEIRRATVATIEGRGALISTAAAPGGRPIVWAISGADALRWVANEQRRTQNDGGA